MPAASGMNRTWNHGSRTLAPMADHRDAYLTLLKSVLLGMTQIETELRCFYLQDCLAGTRRYSYQQLFNIRPAHQHSPHEGLL